MEIVQDDVANSPSNPKKGQLFNWPGGPDVYQGMVKDYTAGDVTAVNFLKIMKGEDMTGIGSGKTLKSTSEDRVFIAFFDHGAPGLIAFPNDVLHSNDLNDALNSMYQKGMFKELVFYMEACESGSMFNGILDPKIKVYAMTAADPSESSWACDYDSSVQTYLNDCFSRNHSMKSPIEHLHV
jgi:legumain